MVGRAATPLVPLKSEYLNEIHYKTSFKHDFFCSCYAVPLSMGHKRDEKIPLRLSNDPKESTGEIGNK